AAFHLAAGLAALVGLVRDHALNLVYHLVDGLVMAQLALGELAGLLDALLDLVAVLLDEVLGLLLQAVEVDAHDGHATCERRRPPGRAGAAVRCTQARLRRRRSSSAPPPASSSSTPIDTGSRIDTPVLASGGDALPCAAGVVVVGAVAVQLAVALAETSTGLASATISDWV